MNLLFNIPEKRQNVTSFLKIFGENVLAVVDVRAFSENPVVRRKLYEAFASSFKEGMTTRLDKAVRGIPQALRISERSSSAPGAGPSCAPVLCRPEQGLANRGGYGTI